MEGDKDNKMDVTNNDDDDRNERKEKKKKKDKDKDRSRSRERDRDRKRSRDRDRDRDRSRRSRSRERSRRSRSRDRSRRSRSRDRNRRSRSRDRDRKRSRSNEKSRGDKNDNNHKSFDKSKPVTLKEILKAMPQLSKAEAVTYMNKHNSEALGVEIDPNLTSSILASSINPSGLPSPALAGGLGGAATKVHREVYIGNTPPTWPPQRIAQLFDDTMKQRGIAKNPQGLSVLNCRVGSDGHHAFIEFYSIEEAAYAVYTLNGMVVGTNPLRISRPSGYVHVPGISDIVAVPDMNLVKGMPFIPLMPPKDSVDSMLTDVDSSTVLIMTNLPLNISENHAKELVGAFGTIKSFNFIRTLTTNPSAVFEFEDSNIIEEVIKALDNLTIGKCKIVVKRVPLPVTSILLEQYQKDGLDPLLKLPPTTVIRLSNIVTENDLSDSECYIDLETDIYDECNKYGIVLSVVIPKQKDVKMGVNGVGDIFVYFSEVEHAMKARDVLVSRTYNGNPIKIVYYPENLFKMQRFALNWVEYDDNKDGINTNGNNNNDNNNGIISDSSSNNNTITTNDNTSNTKVTSMEELD